MKLPATLDWLRARPDGAAWLKQLPGLARAQMTAWGLRAAGPPLSGGHVSLCLPTVRDGQDYVLKLQYPDPESLHEPLALRLWNGRGAVRLIDYEATSRALLLERLRPGGTLAEARHPDPLAVFEELIPQLFCTAEGGICTLAEIAPHWARDIVAGWEQTGRPCPRALVDAALAACAELPATSPAPVLLNSDLHGHNVLSDGTGWRVIDPKPLAGDPAFAIAPVIRAFELGHSRDAVIGRLDRLSSTLGIDRERARRWCLAQTLAWGFGGPYDATHQQTCAWLQAG